MLNIEKTKNGKELKLALEGRLDTTTAPLLETEVKDNLDGTENLVDLTSQAYRSIRRIKQRPVDIIVGTESRFNERKEQPTVESEVYRKGVLLMDKVFHEWLSFAETDLGVARHLYESYHPKPLEIICYHCQQSAEKAIKAVIIWSLGRNAKAA